MSRELTVEEVREQFLDAVRDNVRSWAEIDQPDYSIKDRLDGLAFSILVLLDGFHDMMPGFIVAPIGRAEDMEDQKEAGENWYPLNDPAQVKCDIAGSLHDMWPRTDMTEESRAIHRQIQKIRWPSDPIEQHQSLPETRADVLASFKLLQRRQRRPERAGQQPYERKRAAEEQAGKDRPIEAGNGAGTERGNTNGNTPTKRKPAERL